MKSIIVPRTLPDVAVASAGTAEPLSATELLTTNLIVQWDPDNSGEVYLGDEDVSADQGFVLSEQNPIANIVVDNDPTDPNRRLIDLRDWFVDAANNGDKVKLIYLDVESTNYTE